ncbi:hypothetical protein BLA6860_02659 [Burkholderia lata]|uniref:HEPN domain-containing protein n=1 Tax=Burkholderia lata (strain ATCC 17760 / DSM 23089 / LMG 22485 / NCIMB 9086 / R18194 / 383) TaxID=482957 RepID=UPI00145480E1|nr:HEPN domain-containing protein [Burkholderia lata]VWB57514.1 hypothetical protein BLA6860_02659 [Burkholderia lata]
MSEAQGLLPQSWALVVNPVVLPGEEAFEIAPDVFLRRATLDEIAVIKRSLLHCVPNPFGMANPALNYETRLRVEKHNEGHSTLHTDPLPPSEWCYNVVSNESGDPNRMYLTHLAACISSTPLEMSCMTFSGGGLSGYRGGLVPKYFRGFAPIPQSMPTRELLNEIRAISDRLLPYGIAGDPAFPDVMRGIHMFDSLNFLMESSEFNIVGLFAIVEMLITHNPKLEDRGDSITHQMQAKLPLLMRRFARPIAYAEYFDDRTDPRKIWAALYSYRSALAHGGVAEFGKSLQVLKSATVATDFLRNVVAALLRQALIEPQLLHDLKNC